MIDLKRDSVHEYQIKELYKVILYIRRTLESEDDVLRNKRMLSYMYSVNVEAITVHA